jgi:hypothetical protein
MKQIIFFIILTTVVPINSMQSDDEKYTTLRKRFFTTKIATEELSQELIGLKITEVRLRIEELKLRIPHYKPSIEHAVAAIFRNRNTLKEALGQNDEAMLEPLTAEEKSRLGQDEELDLNLARIKESLMQRFPTHTMAEQVSNL